MNSKQNESQDSLKKDIIEHIEELTPQELKRVCNFVRNLINQRAAYEYDAGDYHAKH